MLLQTVYIYLSVTFFMVILGKISAIRDRNALLQKKAIISFFRIEIILLLLIFSFISGIRYDVGTDHLSYLSDYKTLSIDRYEPIFKYFTILLRSNGFHYAFYFFLLALLQVTLLYYSFRKAKYLYPYIAFVLFFGHYYLSWMNGIRQDVAGCIFFFSTLFIYKKQLIPYLLSCIVAMGFHTSAIILVPLYWILNFKQDYFKNKKIQYCLFLFASYVALKKIDYAEYINPIVEFFLSSSGESYSAYSMGSIAYFGELTTAGNGVVFLSQLIIDLIIIAYSTRLKQEFKKTSYILHYQLYFTGTFFQTLFINNLLLCRPFRYFRLFKLVMSAYLLYYLFNHKTLGNFLVLILLLLLHLIMFVSLVRNVPFTLYWQV